MAGFKVRRRLGAHELEVHDAELAKRAASALLAADERIRVTSDELGFAEAELGSASTAMAAAALVSARRSLGDAFRLNRLNHDAIPGTADEVRARNVRILQLCERAEHALDEQASALADRVARARQAPEIIAGVRADAAHLRTRIPDARETIERLAARYAREALTHVEAHPTEAEQLLGFAEHSVGVAERRREAGRREQAHLALEASTQAVRRAATLLDAVETFEVEALRAEATLAAIVEASRRDLAVALEEPRSRGVANAIAELQAALASLPAVGVNTDPFAHLRRLREAHAVLDAATAAARERATHPVPSMTQVRRAIEAADRQLDMARDVVVGRPGWIGAEALTRLAESERIRVDLSHSLGISAATVKVTGRDDREQMIAMALRVASLASEALHLARRDNDARRWQGRDRSRARRVSLA
ncbi:hypothetical protein DCE93_12550 [Agromyces badenianii]|uniref:Uncharacterized protein n=1 Tax=Agromyces badenianii TaxID=2080742 RepID=A0A2S0WYH8_9MICO|nr:hypothetical protein [Agromyces badenianii]AWB96376.1 hypothetical protein DCE93_12550 [Agromyces badenianii]